MRAWQLRPGSTRMIVKRKIIMQPTIVNTDQPHGRENSWRSSSRRSGPFGIASCGALLLALGGCTTYVETPRPREVYAPSPPAYAPPVYAPPPSVRVEATAGFAIQNEADFYEPLTPYGRWEVVGTYGRCWIPGRVEADWRPYCNGHWQRTEAGWYWASDEPWAWATYHYGRWDLSTQFGWYWVPQTQWAPAWVSWHEGGGYVGWAPLHPTARIVASGVVAVNVELIAPRAFVFVEQRRFLEPVRPATVVVNNTTIINNTVNITNIKVVNNTVINEGPRTTVIEQVSGQKVQAVPVRELRRKQEADVVASHPVTAPHVENNAQPRARSEAAPRETKPQSDGQRRAQDATVSSQEDSQRNARRLEKKVQQESEQRAQDATVKARAESQRNANELEKKAQQDSERRARDAAVKAQEDSQRNAQGLEKKAPQVSQQPGKQKPAASEKGAAQLLKKNNKKKGEEPETPPEKPANPL